MAQSYIDTLKMGCYMIDKGQIPDKDIKALAEVLINRIMEHDSPEDAASYVVVKLSKRIKAENDRLLANYKVRQSKLMANRYKKLLLYIASGLGKMTFRVDEQTAQYLLSQNPTEAPQQPSEGNSGEMADNDNNTQLQGAKKRVKDFKKDCILVDDKEKYLEVLHKQIDGEKSADVIMAKIKGAMSNGRILKPSYQTLINEFPNIKIIVPKSTFYEKMK